VQESILDAQQGNLYPDLKNHIHLTAEMQRQARLIRVIRVVRKKVNGQQRASIGGGLASFQLQLVPKQGT
jgi:hypothetical protein